MKLIIDTDMGSNIDDALALWWLFHQKIEILGISTCTGQAKKRTFAIQKLMPEKIRKKISVASGNEFSLDGQRMQLEAQLLNDIPNDISYPHSLSVLDRVWSHPINTIELLCLGPLTNIAELEIKKPGSLKRFKKITAMGGSFSDVSTLLCPFDMEQQEWNMRCDEKAAKIVFANTNNLYLVPLDATHYFRFLEKEWIEIKQYFPESLLKQSSQMQKENFIIPHDLIAAMSLFDQKNFIWERCDISCENGITSMNIGKNHKVAIWIQSKQLKQKCFEDFKKYKK